MRWSLVDGVHLGVGSRGSGVEGTGVGQTEGFKVPVSTFEVVEAACDGLLDATMERLL
jgi:hypothetical protein